MKTLNDAEIDIKGIDILNRSLDPTAVKPERGMTHNLVRLVESSGINMPEKDIAFLAEMNQYNIEGRYPETFGPIPKKKETAEIIKKAGIIFKWLKKQL